MEVRLQKYLAECGVASRRASEQMIADGRVTVNGAVVREMGVKIDPGSDRVEADGVPVRQVDKLYYILLNKPRGYVTTAKDQFNRPTVLDLVKDIDARLYPVGRLDYDSRGLLLLTNDGAFANRLTHPRGGIQKTYRALIRGHLTREELSSLRRGVRLDTGLTAPARVEVLSEKENSSVVSVTIGEGKNRQVRKMFESVGHSVLGLTRTGEGCVRLGSLPEGKWRHLTAAEVAALMKE